MARALAILLAAGVLVPLGSASASQRACGLTPRIHGVRYDVREVKGSVRCRTVKRVVTHFMRGEPISTSWTCFRGHGSSPYAASCARGAKVLVRVYAPN